MPYHYNIVVCAKTVNGVTTGAVFANEADRPLTAVEIDGLVKALQGDVDAQIEREKRERKEAREDLKATLQDAIEELRSLQGKPNSEGG